MDPNREMQVQEKDDIGTLTFIASKVLPWICVQKDSWKFILINTYISLQKVKEDI